MANTVISIDISFDVIEKQRQLVEEALWPDIGIYQNEGNSNRLSTTTLML